MKKLAISICGATALIILLLGCSNFGDDGKAKEAIRKDLKDPQSAQFSDFEHYHHQTSDGAVVDVVCGKVNSKNEMGGYGGFKPFYYVVKREYGSKEGKGTITALMSGTTSNTNVFLDPAAGMRTMTVCNQPDHPETDEMLLNFSS